LAVSSMGGASRLRPRGSHGRGFLSFVELGSGKEATMGMCGVDERSCHGSHLHREQLERGGDSRFL